jgi:HPt (histidine-containing phosphotransfer) domain-containing protein
MNDHVSKPIDPEVLFATLLRWAKPQRKQTIEPQATPTRTADEIVLPEIAGINVTDGLRRVAGNKRLYRDLLMQFATKSDPASEIAAALKSGDAKLAERLAHTVKGVAGNIGIMEVHSAAQRLEKAIREGHDSAPSLLEEFRALLSTQVEAIRQALPESPRAIEQQVRRPPSNGETASNAISRLRMLLEASDGAADEAFHSLQEAVGGTVEKPQLDALGSFINDFDFETALLKLDEIAKVCARHEGE